MRIRHDLALEQAKAAARTHYSLIYDLLTRLYHNLNRSLSTTKPQASLKPSQPFPINANNAEIVNYISTLTKLLQATQDLKAGLAEKEKILVLEEQAATTRKYGTLPSKPDIDMLYQIHP